MRKTMWTVVWATLAAGGHGLAPAAAPAAPGLVDPSAAVKDEKKPILWYDAKLLTIEGKGWTETEDYYDRLPAKAKGLVPQPVWGLSKDSAGMCLRFVTDAPTISARWKVRSDRLAMPHMPATGVSGLDLYVRMGDRWIWAGAGRPVEQTTTATVLDSIPAGEHEYLLYLPLYNGTIALEIGIPADAKLINPAPRKQRPICVYGTSIVQGGCASRPGMAHVAILGRMLDVPTINLGFSGNGRMEPALAELVAELDAGVYVLDCVPNMSAEQVKERTIPFVLRLRELRPDTPIVMVEGVSHQNAVFIPEFRSGQNEKNAALRTAFEQLQAKGVKGLTYVPRAGLLGDDDEGTVDGTHPTDLGFYRFAEKLVPVLRKVYVK